METQTCVECGGLFISKNKQQKYCSAVCRNAARERRDKMYKETHREQYAEYRAKRRAKKSYLKNWKSGMSLDEKAARARAAGMSYGRYVGMMRLEGVFQKRRLEAEKK